MKKIFVLTFAFLFTQINIVLAKKIDAKNPLIIDSNLNSTTDLTRNLQKKKFVSRHAQQMQLMYIFLELSPKQIQDAQQIDEQKQAQISRLLTKQRLEYKRLKILKQKHASIFAILQQQKAANTAKNQTKKFYKLYNVKFINILDNKQKKLYNIYLKKQKNELKNYQKIHKPGMLVPLEIQSSMPNPN